MAPECHAQTAAATPGGSRLIVLPCWDADRDWAKPQVDSQPQHGTLGPVDPFNRVVRYTPAPGYIGPDRFTFSATDDDEASGTVAMTVDVTRDVDHAPICVAEREVPMLHDEVVVELERLCHDPDAGDAISLVVDRAPAEGTLVAEEGHVVYRAGGFRGVETFRLRATDGTNASAPVDVTVRSVDGAPISCAAPDVVPVRRDEPRTVPDLCEVSGLPDQITAIEEIEPAEHGTLGGWPLTYVPDPGYTGLDEALLLVRAARSTAVVTVRFDVSAEGNLPPTCFPWMPLVLRAGQAKDVRLGCGDPDGDTVTYELVAPPAVGAFTVDAGGGRFSAPSGSGGGQEIELVAVDGHGGRTAAPVRARIVPAGGNTPPECLPQALRALRGRVAEVSAICVDFEGDAIAPAFTAPFGGTLAPFGDGWAARFTPADGLVGPAGFVVAGSDGSSTGSPARVRIAYVAPRKPECRVEDEHRVRPGGRLWIGVMCFDDFGHVVPTLVSAPGHGELEDRRDGYFVYVPDAGFTGDEQLRARAANAEGHVDVTVDIDVDPAANTLPFCWEDTKAITRQQPVDVVPGCYDEEQDPITVALVEGPAHGELGPYDTATGKVRYTPAPDFVGIDTFRFRPSDGRAQGEVVTQRVVVRRTGRNSAPSCAVDGMRQVMGNQAEAVPLVCGDPDNDALTITIVDQPEVGQVEYDPVGPKLVYTPTPIDFRGWADFAYVVSDGLVTSKPIPVHLAVMGTAKAPTCEPLQRAVGHGASVTVQLSCRKWGPSSPDGWPFGNPITLSIATQPAHGTLSAIGADGAVTYTPAAGYAGADSFTYRASDEALVAEPVAVTLAVAGAPGAEPGNGGDPGGGGDPGDGGAPGGGGTPEDGQPASPGLPGAGPGASTQPTPGTQPGRVGDVFTGGSLLPPLPARTQARLTRPRGKVLLRRGRPATLLTVGCAQRSCTVAVSPRLVLRGRGGRTTGVAMAPVRLTLAAGRSGAVRVRLTAAQARRLRAARSGSIRLVVTVRDATGVAARRTVTVPVAAR